MKDDKPLSEPVKYQGAEQILKGRFEGIPFESPVKPVQLELDSEIQFDCHPGVACFNECCRNIDIQLTPYDIVRLKQRLGVSSQEFVARYTLPFAMDFHGLPGLNLMTQPASRECVFLGKHGCTVYEDRPAACRYYALGVMGVRRKESTRVEDVFFLVKESHCLGHNEPRRLTVRQYREQQGVDKYDDMNRDWRDLIIKKRSSGPIIGKPSERSMQLFDMCSYDMDSFGEFIQTPGFQDIFDVDAATMAGLLGSDEQLLQFAFRFLKQVLFGEQSIPVKAGAGERRLETRREHITKKRQAEIEAHKAHDALDDVSAADD